MELFTAARVVASEFDTGYMGARSNGASVYKLRLFLRRYGLTSGK